jgi:DNA-binding HxlR family transcriptional regulator
MIIIMTSICNPAYGGVDDLLELLTKSKSLHILMVMDRKNKPVRFSDLKKLVDSSSTTISRRLKELEAHRLVTRNVIGGSGNVSEYSITKDTKSLSPILQSLFDWVDNRIKQ